VSLILDRVSEGKWDRCVSCLLCFRAILHDSDVYPDPEAFKPERFLTEDGKAKEDPLLMYAFGYGRRCVGISCIFLVATYAS
jgi:cytochrome P450